jgi:hypothetical protein
VALSNERRQLEQAKRLRPDVGWGLHQMDPLSLQPLKDKASAQLALLTQVIGRRRSVAEKLDELARLLPEGIWLTTLDFEGELHATGTSRFRMALSGACFLGEFGQEFDAIQKFEEQIKHNQRFFGGFTTAQVNHINVLESPEQHAYRTFQLNCDDKRTL